MMLLSKKEGSHDQIHNKQDENIENFFYSSQPVTPTKSSNRIHSHRTQLPSTPSFKESRLKSKYGSQSESLWNLQSNFKFDKELFDEALSQVYNDNQEKEEKLLSQKFDIPSVSQVSVLDTPLQEQEIELNRLLDNLEQSKDDSKIKIKEDTTSLILNHFKTEKKRIISHYKRRSLSLLMDKKQKINELNYNYLLTVGKIEMNLLKNIEKLKTKYNMSDEDVLKIEHKLYSKINY